MRGSFSNAIVSLTIVINWESVMALTATKFVKPKKEKKAPPPEVTPVERFIAACKVQLAIAMGKKEYNKITKKPVKSWVVQRYGQKKVIPRVGNSLLLAKDTGYDVENKTAVVKVMEQLIKDVKAGMHNTRINKLAKSRKRKKK